MAAASASGALEEAVGGRRRSSPLNQRTEGLGDVVISTGLQTHEGVQFPGAGQQHHNVGVGKQPQLANPFTAIAIKDRGPFVQFRGLGPDCSEPSLDFRSSHCACG